MKHMKVYIILMVLFSMLIGTGLAQTTGDVNAFKQALEKDGFTVQKGGLVRHNINFLS
jgi:hypothetical protein